jgi:hypothetical protein
VCTSLKESLVLIWRLQHSLSERGRKRGEREKEREREREREKRETLLRALPNRADSRDIFYGWVTLDATIIRGKY